MPDTRFERLWQKWDEAVAAGRARGDIIAELSDESLIELLASETHGRRVERNVLATEALNRLQRTRRATGEVADDVVGALEETCRKVAATAEVVHRAEAAAESLARDAGVSGDPEGRDAHESHRVEVAHQASQWVERARDAARSAEEAARALEDLRARLRDRAREEVLLEE